VNTIARSLLLASLVVAPVAAQEVDTAHATPRPLFDHKDIWYGVAFTAGTIAMLPLDQKIARELQRPSPQANKFFGETATTFRILGSPGALIGGVTLYVGGRLAHSQRVADLGLHGTEAVLISGGITALLKGLAGRSRPYVSVNDPDHYAFGRGFTHSSETSFPSGHATAAFAAASVVTAETTRWWPHSTWYIGPVFYGGATMVGLSRLYNNKHWASDVMMGAAIGTFTGLKVVRWHHSHPGNKIDKWLLPNSVSPNGKGLVVGWTVIN
jgi:membrane-associated phospholipid phosphatase